MIDYLPVVWNHPLESNEQRLDHPVNRSPEVVRDPLGHLYNERPRPPDRVPVEHVIILRAFSVLLSGVPAHWILAVGVLCEVVPWPTNRGSPERPDKVCDEVVDCAWHTIYRWV